MQRVIDAGPCGQLDILSGTNTWWLTMNETRPGFVWGGGRHVDSI